MTVKDVAFVELWKPDIVNLLVKLEGYTYSQAYERWYYAYREFDTKVYKIINYILKKEKGGPTILLNRNPTIDILVAYKSDLIVKTLLIAGNSR